MKKNLFKAFLLWIPFAAVIIFASVLGYALVQQDIRQAANDPQIQIAQDVVQAFAEGASPQDIIPPTQPPVDISMSLDPYIIIYSASGTVLASSASLNGQPPALPAGVTTYVAQHGEDRFTWEPELGVRSAVVVDSLGTTTPGFVLTGRSITEVEIRENNIRNIAALACLAGLIVMFLIIWGVMIVYKKKNS